VRLFYFDIYYLLYLIKLAKLPQKIHHLLGPDLKRFFRMNKTTVNGYEGSQDNVVGTATDYGLDNWGVGVWVPLGSRIFSSPCHPDQLWGSQLCIQWVAGTLSPGGWVKRPGREAGHSPPTNAEVKKMWTYEHISTSLTPSWRSA
jgi:hypothetical protein